MRSMVEKEVFLLAVGQWNNQAMVESHCSIENCVYVDGNDERHCLSTFLLLFFLFRNRHFNWWLVGIPGLSGMVCYKWKGQAVKSKSAEEFIWIIREHKLLFPSSFFFKWTLPSEICPQQIGMLELSSIYISHSKPHSIKYNFLKV